MTSSRTKILVLTPRFPYPVIGGDRLRIHHLCKALARRFDLSLLSLCETRDDLVRDVPRDGVFAKIERVMLPRWRSLVNVAMALPRPTPLQVAYYRSSAFSRAFARLAPAHDLCLAHLVRTAEYARRAKMPVALEMTDAISMNYARVRSNGRWAGVRSFIYSLEVGRLAAYERAMIKELDVVTLVSEVDRQYVTRGLGEARDNTLVVSNGVDLARFPFRASAPSPVAVFIGSMVTLQNLDACMYFIREVLPVVRRRIDLGFRIVGHIGERDARKLRGFAGVEVTGPVDDIATAVKGAGLAVCPVRLGAGIQNKVLEYMALGIPTVTSSVGLEGLGARSGREVLVADTPEAYADWAERIFAQPAWASDIARAARRYVEQHHDWDTLTAPFVARIEALARSP